MFTLNDLPEGWTPKDGVNSSWLFVDYINSSNNRIAILRDNEGDEREGKVEQYKDSKWTVLVPQDLGISFDEAIHWVVTYIRVSGG